MDNSKGKNKVTEVIFWSISLPGFGQFLNRKYIKVIVLIVIEVIINVKGNVIIVIMKSYLGDISAAIEHADYLWLMFYPCVYLFAIWDAYKDAGENSNNYLFLPFVFSAYIGTIGVIYSSIFTINGILIMSLFFPLICTCLWFLF